MTPPTLQLSVLDQCAITLALDLEHAGYVTAAAYLRSTVKPLQGLNWDDPVVRQSLNTPSDLLRIHRGSTPSVQTTELGTPFDETLPAPAATPPAGDSETARRGAEL